MMLCQTVLSKDYTANFIKPLKSVNALDAVGKGILILSSYFSSLSSSLLPTEGTYCYTKINKMRIRYAVSKNSEKAGCTSAFNTYALISENAPILLTCDVQALKFSPPTWPAVD